MEYLDLINFDDIHKIGSLRPRKRSSLFKLRSFSWFCLRIFRKNPSVRIKFVVQCRSKMGILGVFSGFQGKAGICRRLEYVEVLWFDGVGIFRGCCSFRGLQELYLRVSRDFQQGFSCLRGGQGFLQFLGVEGVLRPMQIFQELIPKSRAKLGLSISYPITNLDTNVC